MKTHKQTIYIALKSTHQSRRISLIQGSHYLLILKFKDFQDPSNFNFQGPILDGSLQHEHEQ